MSPELDPRNTSDIPDVKGSQPGVKPTVTVHEAGPGSREDTVRVLVKAFDTDPLIRWLAPSTSLVPLFRMSVYFENRHVNSTLHARIGDEVVGAAVWDPIGYRGSVLRPLGIPLALWAGRQHPRRSAIVDRVFRENRPTFDHWYLSILGAVRSGQGIGTALLDARVPQLNGPAYLVSSNIRNNPLYERFGFEVVKEVTLPDNGPVVYPMYRPAQ